MMSTTQAAFQEMADDGETDVMLLPGDMFHSRNDQPEVLHNAEQVLLPAAHPTGDEQAQESFSSRQSASSEPCSRSN